MSGASFDYLYQAQDVSDLGRKSEALASMAHFLLANRAPDAAEETALLILAVARWEGGLAYDPEAVRSHAGRLAGAWKAAEWWKSGRGSEAAFLRALADYRGVELPPCETCGGSGLRRTGRSNRYCAAPDCVDGRDVSRMREAA